MIILTRLDNSRFLINLEAVKCVEVTPDTLVTYVNGDSVFVKETLEEIEHRVVQYKMKILTALQAEPPHPQ